MHIRTVLLSACQRMSELAATVAVVDLPEVGPDSVDPSALGPHAADEGGNDEGKRARDMYAYRLN